MPVTRTPEELDGFIEKSPRNLLIWTDGDDSLTTQVRQILENVDDDRLPTLEQIAGQLHMTAYTLSRKLKAEGSSYQKIKDNLRRDQAVIMLTRQNLTVSEISSQLGFTEPGAFPVPSSTGPGSAHWPTASRTSSSSFSAYSSSIATAVPSPPRYTGTPHRA